MERDAKPRKGLLPLEWVIIVYAAITTLIVLFCLTKLDNPDAMIWGRVRTVAITFGLWAVYRFLPCRATMFLRVLIQMALLGWWYSDTYYINRLFPNLDHIIAHWDQYFFGCQPALLFAERCTAPILSEFLEISYSLYYPIIVAVCVFYFAVRQKEFQKCCFIVTASFFTYYLVFDLVPVAGPMYYYPAIGMSNVVKGIFPMVGDYFNTHLNMMKAPGWADGIGYQLITLIHGEEHPTGAFPSSHVGLSVVSLILAAKSRNKTLTLSILPFVIGIGFATVYIRAHYVTDAIWGLITGIAFYAFWAWVAKRQKI